MRRPHANERHGPMSLGWTSRRYDVRKKSKWLIELTSRDGSFSASPDVSNRKIEFWMIGMNDFSSSRGDSPPRLESIE